MMVCYNGLKEGVNMKKCGVLLLILILVGCSINPTSQSFTTVEPSDNVDGLSTLEIHPALTNSMWEFTEKTKSLILTDENEVYSPVSLYSALTLLIPAAKQESKENLLSALALENPEHLTNFFKRHNILSDEFSSLLTNSIWYGTQEEFSQSIEAELSEDYIVSVHQADFSKEQETSNLIKEFIDNRTNGFIKDLEVKVSSDNSLMLLNTLYLKDLWSQELFMDTTINFTTPTNETIQVDGSKTVKENGNYFEDEQAQLFYYSLKNTGGVLFIKPTQDLNSYFDEVNLVDVYSKLETMFENNYYDVTFEMPYTDISSRFEKINDFLKPLGFEEILSTTNPQFSYLENGTPQFVSDIIQQARMVVDNKGVEAAAFTQVDVETTSAPPMENEKVDFILDKPYLMIVLDAYQNPLFISSVLNPNQSAQ